MSGSSSGSWSRGGGPPDIIDLDKFMRGAVRPSRPDAVNTRCAQLVVDAGGVNRKALTSRGSSLRTAPKPLAPVNVLSSTSSELPKPHSKRYSHDSGLSDGSYTKKKHRPHRRSRGGGEVGRPGREPTTRLGGTVRRDSCDSLRAFRTICERALLDQQQQIAKVAQLCERLTERPLPSSPTPACKPAPHRTQDKQDSPDTSDVSTSSRSTRDPRRKDKHRTEDCKTYKIIMNKLDELNRLFAARQLPATRHLPARLPLQRPSSSGSVSVSDKVVGTDPMPPSHPAPVKTTIGRIECSNARPESLRSGLYADRERIVACRAVTNTCALDISPRQARPLHRRHNVATESVVQGDSVSSRIGIAGDPRCNFDLDDPVHLYAQAKRLQEMPPTTRRVRSVESGICSESRATMNKDRGVTLCGVCRRYWRALTRYVTAQVFCNPDEYR